MPIDLSLAVPAFGDGAHSAWGPAVDSAERRVDDFVAAPSAVLTPPFTAGNTLTPALHCKWGF